jgi:hypothetical protein
MNRSLLIVAPLAGVLLGGCLSSGVSLSPPAYSPSAADEGPAGPYGPARLNAMRVGMSRQETLSIMGPPDSTSAQANAEYLVYDLETEPGFFDRPYVIRLVGGQVESFGRISELADLYDRPVASPLPGPTAAPGPGFGRVIPAPGYATASAPPDLAGRLRQLQALKEAGALTDAEFHKAKQLVLEGL